MELEFFDSIVVPFRHEGWWYVAIKRLGKQWTIVVLSNNAPSPQMWPKDIEVLTLPGSTYEKLDGNFLIFPCLRAMVNSEALFNDGAIRQVYRETDVPGVVAEVKEIVAAAVSKPRVEIPSVERDAVAKETQEVAKTLAGLVQFGLYVLGKQHSRGVFFYSTFLIANLLHGKSYAKWMKRANPAEYDYIVVPIHDTANQHWLGAVLWRNTAAADVDRFELTILDSLGESKRHSTFRKALKSFFSSIRIADHPLARVPIQTDGWSCGDHLLRNIENVLRDPVAFTRAVGEAVELKWELDEKSLRAALRKAAEEEEAAEEKRKLAEKEVSSGEATEDCIAVDAAEIHSEPVGAASGIYTQPLFEIGDGDLAAGALVNTTNKIRTNNMLRTATVNNTISSHTPDTTLGQKAATGIDMLKISLAILRRPSN
ncbi:Peptidase C48, SUMO/Sentrin/Ubl1 [Niveomyces insectorum RCEF 264]|uniref:Peptidase C48, SUMO/Sentrin/Ubl1 n=1 Tax=Niveomyces insectorum RCEF 264 TaxID=1081102 RepID=A0A162J407_9HYPO|nr:Peptidase C48, SUMO/Sentrin/Ubl1 [Niveomyces insectorum RCEF 264]